MLSQDLFRTPLGVSQNLGIEFCPQISNSRLINLTCVMGKVQIIEQVINKNLTLRDHNSSFQAKIIPYFDRPLPRTLYLRAAMLIAKGTIERAYRQTYALYAAFKPEIVFTK